MPEYVYAVVEPGSSPPPAPGVGAAPPRLVVREEVAALVSHLEQDELRIGRREMEAHARVLSEALAHGPVLPLRMGTVMADENDIGGRLLEPHHEALRAQLDRFTGCFEADLRVTYEEDALMREAIRLDPRIAELGETVRHRDPDATYYDRIRLGELVSAAVDSIRTADAQDLLDLLRQVSVSVAVSPPAHERVALNAAFLLDRARGPEFDDALEAIAQGQAGRLRFKYTGPLPPHSFVEPVQA